MQHISTRLSHTAVARTAALALATAGLGAMAFLPATASAAPVDRAVPGTSCTVGQVERTIDATSPEVAGYLRNPRIRAEFERIVVLPEPQRRAEAQRLLDRNPRISGQVDRYRPLIEARIAQIVASCDRF